MRHSSSSRLVRSGPCQHRTAPTTADALQLLRDRCMEVDNHSRALQQLPVLWQQDAAATRGHHQWFALAELGKGFTLTLPEAALALLLEDVRNIDAGVAFDFGIAVCERRADQSCEHPAHGGLAGAHRTDEVDVSLVQHAPQSIRPPEGGRSCIMHRLRRDQVTVIR